LARYELNGNWYTPNELSDKSGIPAHTIRDRLRRGFSVEEAVQVSPVHNSVRAFCEASWYEDWIGMSTSDLYKIYWKWCISNGYSSIPIQGFSRQLLSMYPMLKVVPIRKDGKCYRMLRLRG
jgi:hypothetical protein